MPLPKPYVRGLDHLVFAASDCGRRLLADLRRRRVAGRLSSSMARDVSYWKMIIFPILLTIIGSAVSIAELHSACTAYKDDGLPSSEPNPGPASRGSRWRSPKRGLDFCPTLERFVSWPMVRCRHGGLPHA